MKFYDNGFPAIGIHFQSNYLESYSFSEFDLDVAVFACSIFQRRLILLLVLASTLLPTIGLAQNKGRVVQVGVFQVHPLVFVDDNGEAAGLYVDLLNEMASREGWQIQYIQGTWADGLQKVRIGALDLMTVTMRTPERDEFLDFNSEEVMMLWGQIFSRRSAKINNILDLHNLPIALMKDDLNGQNFLTNAARFGVECKVIETDSHHEVFRLVEDGVAVGGVAPNIFGYVHAHEYGLAQTPILFAPNSIFFASPEGRNHALLQTIDQYLKEWKSDPESIYYHAIATWFGPAHTHSPFPRWLFATLVVVGFLSLLLLLWNRLLNHQVVARTRQLKASESKIRAIFDQTFLFVGILETDGTVVEVNPTALKFFDADLEDVIGLPFWECPWWGRDPQVQADIERGVAKAAGGQVHYGEAIHPDKDQNPHIIEFTIKPVFNEQGQVVMLLPEGHDVTEREQLASDLRQSQKIEAIGTLAGGIAHDFNNILTAISGFNELALEDAKGQPIIEDSLREVGHATERARSLIQQILTFSRRKEMEKAVFAPSIVVNEAVPLLRSSLPTTISIETNLQSHGSILADPTQFHQIIMNLCTNAFHAMEETGGILGISLRDLDLDPNEPILGAPVPAGSYVVLEISDTGIGMDQAMMRKIFEPYFTSKDSGRGTGLGLSVVHGIVKSSGAHLELESQPGLGTTFKIFFPTSNEEGEIQKFENPDELPGELPDELHGKERLIFVDDEKALTHLAERYFKALGYEISIFTSSAEAWDSFADNPGRYDLLITDQTMPQMTGIELIRQIRSVNKQMPIILCTGYNAGLNAKEINEIGINRILHKPMPMKSLAREIRGILGHTDALLP